MCLPGALHITPPTASNTLQRMERGRLDRTLPRRNRPADRACISDREIEKNLREEAHASFKELDNEMTSMMTRQEQETLRQSLLKVRGYLIQAGDEDTGHACPGRVLLAG